jgi:hypothetical protein
MADSLGVLLLTWNQAFYRYGSFDFSKLEACIAKNMRKLDSFRASSILDYTAHDDPQIVALFDAFLAALAIPEGKKKGQQSPVAVAKTLHLLAPGVFPLWDRKIALAHRCNYSRQPTAQYLTFIKETLRMARALGALTPPEGKTLL